MTPLKGILFDFNGTLFFDSKIHFEVFKRVALLFGKKPFSEEFMIKNVFGRTNALIYRQNFSHNATDAECKRFSDIKVKMYFDTCLERKDIMRLVPGVPEMLDFLKASGIPYCISTGSDREEMEFFVRHLGLERWFNWDNIVYTDGSFAGKPAPDCYILAAARLGLTPSECVVFEDGESGIRAARAAGAGAVIAVHECGIPSPVDSGMTVDGDHLDLTEWRSILSNLGFPTERK